MFIFFNYSLHLFDIICQFNQKMSQSKIVVNYDYRTKTLSMTLVHILTSVVGITLQK